MKRALFIILAAALAACSTSPPKVSDYGLALRTDNNPDNVRVFEAHLRNTLNQSVTLADNVLLDTPYLTLERRANRALEGRILEKPDRYEFRGEGQLCWLVHMDTGRVIEAKGLSCVPYNDGR